MSASNPTVGDVWAFQQDPPAQAVIVSELAGANGFQLMSRTGRIINVSRSSLRHMWSYTGTSHVGPCSIGGCLLPSGVHVRGEWFCGPHAPRNQTLGLPGDSLHSVPNQPVNGALDHCPNCQVTRDPRSNMTMVEGITIHRCSCRARWIALLAQGTPEDGINLGEDIQAAYNLLEDELCSPIRAYIGTTALSALTRTFLEINGDSPSFAGVPLIHSHTYGNDTVLLVGVPLASHDDEAAFEKLLGTFWRHKEWIGLICRVYGAEESTHSDRMVQICHWNNPAEGLGLSESQLLRDFTPSEAPTKTVFENGTVHVQLPAEYVGSLTDLPRLEVKADAPRVLKKAELADPSDHRPQSGEAWWNVTTGKPVQVFGSGSTQTGLAFTRVVYENGVAGRLLTDDFVRYYHLGGTNEIELVVGNEYQRADGTVWSVRSVNLPLIFLEGSNQDVETIRLLDFKAKYQPYVRRSALDRLFDEEDLV